MVERLLIYGASGHGKVVADAARLSGWEVAGFADDDEAKRGTRLLGYPVDAIGRDEAVRLAHASGARFAVAIGDNAIRRLIYEALVAAGLPAAIVRHPSAVIAATARLGPGTVAFAGVVVNPDTVVGANTILNTACSLDHDNTIGDHVHLSPGARLGGGVRVGAGVHVGLGACLRNNVTIGAWTVIGMGAVVVKDIPPGVTAFGVPARVQEER